MKFWEVKCRMGIHKWDYYTINEHPSKRRMCKCCFKIQWYLVSFHPELSSGYRDLPERDITEEEKRDIKLRKLDI